MKLITTAAAVLMLTSGASFAASFDFGTLAQGGTTGVGEGDWGSRSDANNVAGGDFVGGEYIVDGIAVVGSGGNYQAYDEDVMWVGPHLQFTTSVTSSYGYLDGLSGGKPAGLGTCNEVNGSNQCSPSNDDNTGPTGGLNVVEPSMFEYVSMSFDRVVGLEGISFRDDNHNVITSGAIGLSIDDPSSTEMTFIITSIETIFSLLAGDVAHPAVDSQFWSFARLSNDICNGGSTYSDVRVRDGGNYGGAEWGQLNCTNFYIDGASVAPIPLPAAGWLLIAGLGGLAAMRRKSA
jgi:hypothetical protein